MENGVKHGKGALEYLSGEKYEGLFVDGKCHGFGVLSFLDGGQYEGEWFEDEMHGRGVRSYENGDWCVRLACLLSRRFYFAAMR